MALTSTTNNKDTVFGLSPFAATLWLIGLTLVFRIIGGIYVGFGTGEAYYLSSAREFHLSYFDQPPVSLWMTWATLYGFGSENILVLRLPFILVFSISTYLVYEIAKRLHSPLAGFYAAVIVNACVLLTLSIGSWLQPDAPMMLFWLATTLVLVEIFFGRGSERPYLYWSIAGVLLGLTFLSKYHAVFIVLGTGLYMLFNKHERRWLLHPAPYLAVLVALIIFTPVIIWNSQNEWASFGFQGSRAIAEENHLRWDGLLRMIWGQLLYMVPWLALPALYIGVKALRAGPTGIWPSHTPAGAAALFSYIAWPPIIFFTLVALWSDTQFHFHWQAPGYLMLFILMGIWVAENNTAAKRRWLYGSFIAIFLILGLLISQASTGWLRNYIPGEWEDPTALQLPWTELGEALEREGAYTAPNTFVGGVSWLDCGFIDNQVAGRRPLACLGEDPRNLAYNFNAQDYAGWGAYFASQTTNYDWVIAELEKNFETVEHVETINIKRSGIVELRNIQLFKATGFRP